ncbi:MAG TPA: hypothetical protein VNI36_00940 [Candidatus Dormibacteraeota bacterium]|nr:hypothetical protein [Candidatus Dormibacteraeota bacterium]
MAGIQPDSLLPDIAFPLQESRLYKEVVKIPVLLGTIIRIAKRAIKQANRSELPAISSTSRAAPAVKARRIRAFLAASSFFFTASRLM